MKNLILFTLMLFALPVYAQDALVNVTVPTLEDHVRYEYQVAAEAILESDEACTHANGSCTRVDVDYPYPYRERYNAFLDTMAEATASMTWEDNEERQSMVATVLAVAWAESTWDTLTAPGAAGECGPLQIISCEYGPWRSRTRCQDTGYVDSGTRPTCSWLEDPVNSLTWFVGYWEERGGPAAYNGCRTFNCSYALLFDRRYRAAINALD